jgi:hypothetical protein
MPYGMITISKLINISMTSYNYHDLIYGIRTFKIYCVTMLYNRSWNVFILCALWATSSHFPSTPVLGNHHSTLCLCEFNIFDSIHKRNHSICFSMLDFISLNISFSSFIYVTVNDDFLLFKAKKYKCVCVCVCVCVYHTFFIFSSIIGICVVSISWLLSYCEWYWNKQGSASISLEILISCHLDMYTE